MRIRALKMVKVDHCEERWSVFDPDNAHLGWVDHVGRQWLAITPHNERLSPALDRTTAAQQLQMHHALRRPDETDQQTVG